MFAYEKLHSPEVFFSLNSGVTIAAHLSQQEEGNVLHTPGGYVLSSCPCPPYTQFPSLLHTLSHLILSGIYNVSF